MILHPVNYDNDNVSHEASRKTLDEVVYEKAHALMYSCVDATLEYFLFQDRQNYVVMQSDISMISII